MEKNYNNVPLLVSFVIPYHNEDIDMLRQCIDSILALSLSQNEREVIVIDDGSDYSPMNELLAYGDDIIYVRKPNGGLSSARNLGIVMSGGRYIQFVDSDDCLIPASYNRCLDVARYHDPELVLFDFTRSSPNAELGYGEPAGPVSGAEYMRHNNLRPMAWGYLFSKAVLHDLRFTEGIVHEDEEFTPQLFLRCERLYELPVKAYFYRRRNESITCKKNMKWSLKRLDDTEGVILNLYRISERLPHEERLALRRRVDQLTMDYLYNVICLTRSLKNLRERADRLRPIGLFPLPDKGYTKKYSAFRRMINSPAGQRILVMTLPLLR